MNQNQNTANNTNSNNVNPNLSSIGNLPQNVAALLAYLSGTIVSWVVGGIGLFFLAIIGPLFFFLMEKKNMFVKKHAAQALVLYGFSIVLGLIFTIISSVLLSSIVLNPTTGYNNLMTFAGGFSLIAILMGGLNLVFTVFAIIAMIKAYNNQYYSIPLVGKIAEKLVK